MSSRDVPVYCIVQDTYLARRVLRRNGLWSREVWSAAGNTGTDVAGGVTADVVDWVERDAFEEPEDDVDFVLRAVPEPLAARR